LKKWAQTKKASTKNDISVRKNKVSGVLKNQAQYARAHDKALMCTWNCITKNWHSLLGKQLTKLQRPQKELPVPAHHN